MTLSQLVHGVNNTHTKQIANGPWTTGPGRRVSVSGGGGISRMTYREALVAAIEFIRTRTDERELLHVAKALERKAEKMRARTEAPAAWEHWCECGERKPEDQSFCHACRSAIPMKLWITFHTGRPAKSAAAWTKMKRLARARGREPERIAA